MSEPVSWHVRPDEEGWRVHREDNRGAVAVASSRQDALNLARRTAELYPSTRIVVHDENGTAGVEESP